MSPTSYRSLFRALAFLAVVLLCFYYLRLRPLLIAAGIWRDIQPIGNEACETVVGLQACEKMVFNRETEKLYLACSDPQTRTRWMPAMSFYDPPRRSTDYIATYDPSTSQIERLGLPEFDSTRRFGVSVHGMDVVSSANAKDLYIYLVNHRPPTADPVKFGADSVIEILKTVAGREGELIHVQTIEHPLIVSPNDVVGSSDGKSFYFTNDNPVKIGHFRKIISLLLHAKDNSIVYCHVETGCKIALDNLKGANGITKSPWNETYYLANHRLGGVKLLGRQLDDTLALVDEIPTDRILDNLSVDSEGHLWAASMPKVFSTIAYFADPFNAAKAPSSVHRISTNTDASRRGNKYRYRLDKVFEDDGNLASGSTSVVHDSENRKLFLHGLVSPYLTICNVSD